MADRYRTPDGWTVEVIELAEGDRLRIRHHRFFVADVANVDDLGRWIPAAELARLEREPLVPNLSAAAGSCRGRKYTDPQPGSRHRIMRPPLPRGCAFCVGSAGTISSGTGMRATGRALVVPRPHHRV